MYCISALIAAQTSSRDALNCTRLLMARSQTKHAVAQPRFAGITSYCTVSVTGRGDTPSPKPHALYCTAHSPFISNLQQETGAGIASCYGGACAVPCFFQLNGRVDVQDLRHRNGSQYMCLDFMLQVTTLVCLRNGASTCERHISDTSTPYSQNCH